MQNVGVKEETLIKAPGVNAIIPSELTRKMAWLAARFGSVVGWGKDKKNNQPITVDTDNHPKDHIVVFGDGEDSLDKMLDYIKNKNDKKADADRNRGDA